MRPDAVVSHHMNPFRSGVARFNEVLAANLDVPRLRITDPAVRELRAPLMSFKVSELDADARGTVEDLASHFEGRAALSLFLHNYTGTALEDRLVAQSAAVYCGNHEIFDALGGRGAQLVEAWAPGLISDCRRYDPAEVSVFSFGMAHKLRTDMFRRLQALLDGSGRTYTLHISNANHETSNIGDAQLVYEDMHAIFPRGLYFMGALSDVAVYNELVKTTFFAAFFTPAARANNTSIASAMEHGAVVITNLDRHSPPELVHMDNVIDIERCDELPFDPLVLRRMSVRAMETARERTWGRLVDVVSGARV